MRRTPKALLVAGMMATTVVTFSQQAGADGRCQDYSHTHTRPSGWHEEDDKANHYTVAQWPYIYMWTKGFIRESPSITYDYGYQGCSGGIHA